MKFHKDGSKPQNGEIFVFGSNLAGIHGAGAAYAALGYYGAQMRIGKGLTGHSYAIPSKDENIETLPIPRIIEYIKEFVQFTLDHPELEFFVTRIGCVLAGIDNKDIAPHFKGAINCSFAEEWKEYLL